MLFRSGKITDEIGLGLPGATVFIVEAEKGTPTDKNGDFRSEERRVGKECRSRWSPYH